MGQGRKELSAKSRNREDNAHTPFLHGRISLNPREKRQKFQGKLMNNDFLSPQNAQNMQHGSQQQPVRRSGLLSSYGQQAREQSLPGQPGNNQPAPQSQFPQPPPVHWQGPSFMERPIQMLARWSNKLAAMRKQQGPPVSPDPLVRYHTPQAGATGNPDAPTPARPEIWQLSRTQKITRLMRKRRARDYQNGPNARRVGTIIISVVAALLVIVLGSGGISSYAYYSSQLPQVQSLANLQVSQSTRIYDRNGNLLYTLYNDKYGRSTPISYNTIPGFMQDAQIAAEDKTFWTNDGVDIPAIIRSGITNASSQQIQTGASTLTQQVVKNLSHNTAPSIERKISEAALAIGMNQEYPKWKILEMYFNIAPYGTQEQGVEAAAQDFFGLKPQCNTKFNCTPAISFLDRDLSKCKNAKDQNTCEVDPILGLARATLLASIPQNPPTFDPLTNPDNYQLLLERQDYVLQQMLDANMQINLGTGSTTKSAGPITNEVVQKVEALSKDLKFAGFHATKKAPHFVDWVISTLAESLGNGDAGTGMLILQNSGFNIRTTLDLNLETYVENAVKRHLNKPEYQEFQGITVTLSEHNNVHDAAVVVINAKTGEVLAMNGSANWNDTSKAGSGQINMALRGRQPASTFKTIAVAAAYQAGWYPGIVAPDFKTYFPIGSSQSQPVSKDTTYVPPDYGGSWHNLNTNIELAISNSFNIPALKAQYYAGAQNVYNMAARLGITSLNKADIVPSMTLGTAAVSPLEMTSAYQTFANEGTHIPPHNILDIFDNYGHNLYHYDPAHPNGSAVLSKQIAYLVTSTISNTNARSIEFPGDTLLNMHDWTLSDGTYPDVAAKTGTSDDFKDNWTIGYTPDVVVGVWAGNADESSMINSIGITGAAPIWHSVIEYVSGKCNTATDNISCPTLTQKFTDRHFTVPDGVVQQQVNTVNGLQGSGYLSYMLESQVPQQTGVLNSCSTTKGNKKNCNNTTP